MSSTYRPLAARRRDQNVGESKRRVGPWEGGSWSKDQPGSLCLLAGDAQKKRVKPAPTARLHAPVLMAYDMLSVSGIARTRSDDFDRLNQSRSTALPSGGPNDVFKVSSAGRPGERSPSMERPFGTGHSGLGNSGPHREALAELRRTWVQGRFHADWWPGVDCTVPIAYFLAANSFTVTRKVTSVTTLPLVESDLIGVGRLPCCRRLRKWLLAVNGGFGGALRRSFPGGVRIQ